MHDAELRRPPAIVRLAARLRRSDRRVGEGAPHPLVLAGVGVEHDHAPVAVAVSDEDLVGGRVHEGLRRPHRVHRVVVAAAPRAPAYLQQQLALRRELQQHVVRFRRRAVAADPDVAVRSDMDPVLVRGPVVAVAWTAPSPHERAVLLERQHRRRRRPLVLGHRTGPMEHPDRVVRAHGHRRRLPQHPVVRDARPRRIDLEPRHAAVLLPGRDGYWTRLEAQESGAERDRQCDCRQAGDHSPVHVSPPLVPLPRRLTTSLRRGHLQRPSSVPLNGPRRHVPEASARLPLQVTQFPWAYTDARTDHPTMYPTTSGRLWRRFASRCPSAHAAHDTPGPTVAMPRVEPERVSGLP